MGSIVWAIRPDWDARLGSWLTETEKGLDWNLNLHLHPLKSTMNEDVFPVENGDFPMSFVSFQEGMRFEGDWTPRKLINWEYFGQVGDIPSRGKLT